jgi:hypothetical protein
MTLGRTTYYHVECCYDVCRILFIVIQNVNMLSVIMLSVSVLSVIMLSAIMLSVVMLDFIMLSVVAPVSVIHFHPSLIFECKARNLPLHWRSCKWLHLGRLYTCLQISDLGGSDWL